MKLKTVVFVSIFKENFKLRHDDIVEQCYNYLDEISLKVPACNLTHFKGVLKSLIPTFGIYWKRCKYSWKTFEGKHQQWLQADIKFEFEKKRQPKPTSHLNRGRPSVPFTMKSIRSKRIDISNISLSSHHNPELLIRAALYAGRIQARAP